MNHFFFFSARCLYELKDVPVDHSIFDHYYEIESKQWKAFVKHPDSDSKSVLQQHMKQEIMAKTLIKNLVSVDIQVILHYALPFLANLLFFEPSLGPWRSRQNLHAEFLAQSLQGAQFLGPLHSLLVSPEDDSVYREVHEQKRGRCVSWGSRCGHKRKMHVKSFISLPGGQEPEH